MVDQNHNNQKDQDRSGEDLSSGVMRGSDNAARVTPTDLDASEQSTRILMDGLPSGLPADEVDNLILQQAALAVELSATDELEQAHEQAANVVPLYNHENEVFFGQVFPKVFVAAAVVVLAVVVVPLVDRTGITDLSNTPPLQTASSNSIDQIAEPLAASDIDLVESDDADALADSAFEKETSYHSLSAQAGSQQTEAAVEAELLTQTKPASGTTLASDVKLESDTKLAPQGEATENPFTKELAIAAESETAKAGNTDESGVSGVTRTTIISTEASATPSVVQSINVTSAARVRRKIEVEDASDVSDASGEVTNENSAAPESDNSRQRPSANLAAFQASNSVAPAYRRSLHRWKAEILKLSRLGKQQEALDEYELYIKEHPRQAFDFDQNIQPAQSLDNTAPSSESMSEPNATPTDENVEQTPVLILPVESNPSPEK